MSIYETARGAIDPSLQDDEELSQLLQVNPVQAVIKATWYVEIVIRNLAGDIGRASATNEDWQAIATDLVKQGIIPPETLQAISAIQGLRDSVVHGEVVDLRAATLTVEGAVAVIRSIRDVPREVHRVYTILPVFTDETLASQHRSIQGLVLCSFDSPGSESHLRVFPTQLWYEPGARVMWQWDVSHAVGEAWYQHPITGTVAKAWDRAGLFVGAQMPETDAAARYWLQEPRPWAVRTTITLEGLTKKKDVQEALAATDVKIGPAGVWSVWHVVDAPNERMATAVVKSGLEVAVQKAGMVARILDTYVYPGSSVTVGYAPSASADVADRGV